jgi:hypothetical protein
MFSENRGYISPNTKTNYMSLTIKLHFPHDRLAIGWDLMYKNEEYDTTLVVLYLLLITLEMEF